MNEVIIHSVVMDDLPYIILLTAIVLFVPIGVMFSLYKKGVGKGRRAYIFIVLAVVFVSSVWSLSRYTSPAYDYIAKHYKTAEGRVTGYTSDEKKCFIYTDGYPYRI